MSDYLIFIIVAVCLSLVIYAIWKRLVTIKNVFVQL